MKRQKCYQSVFTCENELNKYVISPHNQFIYSPWVEVIKLFSQEEDWYYKHLAMRKKITKKMLNLRLTIKTPDMMSNVMAAYVI